MIGFSLVLSNSVSSIVLKPLEQLLTQAMSEQSARAGVMAHLAVKQVFSFRAEVFSRSSGGAANGIDHLSATGLLFVLPKSMLLSQCGSHRLLCCMGAVVVTLLGSQVP